MVFKKNENFFLYRPPDASFYWNLFKIGMPNVKDIIFIFQV